MTESPPGRIFISYRRQETAWPARQLYDVLAERFGAEQVFKDVDTIEPGDDFVERITTAVSSCDVLLALIGPKWLTIKDKKTGRRRLDNPEDFVRLEIQTALNRNVRVIPILIDDAQMPRANELPADLTALVRRQAVEISPTTFDTKRLMATVDKILAEQARRAADEQARRAAVHQARREADKQAPLEAEGQARREVEKKARGEAEVQRARSVARRDAPLRPSPTRLVERPRLLQTVRHGGTVRAVAFSSDGRRLATGSYDATARVWDIISGRELLKVSLVGVLRRLVRNEVDLVTGVAFSPDGRLLATANGYTAGIWDAASGRHLSFVFHGGLVTAVAFSPDGRRLATGGSVSRVRLATGGSDMPDGAARIWDAETGQELLENYHDAPVNAVAFNPDGRRLATGSGRAKTSVRSLLTTRAASGENSARIWDTTSGHELLKITHDAPVTAVAFSPDGRKLATGSADARIWDATSGQELLKITGDKPGVRAMFPPELNAVAFSPDGRWLATARSNVSSASVWDATTGRALLKVTHDKMVFAVAFSPNGRQLATGSVDKTARIWALAEASVDGPA